MSQHRLLRGLVAAVASVAMAFTGAVTANAAPIDTPTIEQLKNTAVGDYVSTVPTPQHSDVINPNYDRSYDNYEERSDSGLLHPGILLDREELNIMRDMVWIGAEPWASAFKAMQQSPYAQLDYHMDGPFETISSDRETYGLTRSSTAAYELTLMWYITGNQAYADKAKSIILDWAHTVKTDAKYDHLRMGTSTNKFAIAAEIMRYTPSSGWTDQDTKDFNAYLDLVNYAIDKPYEYLNQGGYALIAYIAKAVFQNDWDSYAKAVEREAYNKDGGWKNGISVNYSLSSMVFNDGSFVEMGRDQWHAIDNLGTHATVIKTTDVQGTKVDDKGNIVTTGGESLYDFQNEKLLKMQATVARYNFGEETPFVAGHNAWGQPTEYSTNSSQGRGADIWEPSVYYHYLYKEGHKPGDARTIRNATEGPDQTVDPYLTYGQAYAAISHGENTDLGRQPNVDFPDFKDLTYTPLQAIKDTPLAGAPSSVEAADSYGKYNRIAGSKFSGTGNDERAVNNDGRNGGAISEPYTDEDGNTQFMTSDVNNGEWIGYSIDFDQQFGATADNPVNTLLLSYSTNSSGADIDVFVGDYKDKPTVDDYKAARDAGKLGTVHVNDMQGYTNFGLAEQQFADASQFTGRKTVYFYFYNSSNIYHFNANTGWLKFVSSRAADENTAATAGFSSSNATVDGTKTVLKNGASFGWSNMDFDTGYSAVTVKLGNTVATGGLTLYRGDAKLETIDLSGKSGAVTVPAADPRALLGRNDVRFAYAGDDGAEIDSVTFDKVASKVNSYADIAGDSYLQAVSGTVTRNGDGSATLTGDKPYVSYNAVPFLNGPSRIGMRIKADKAVTLNVDQLDLGGAQEDGSLGRGGNLAVFDVPDTSSLSDDGWVTLQTPVKKTDITTGNNMLGFAVIGDADAHVQIASFRFDPDDNPPSASLKPESGDAIASGQTVTVDESSKAVFTLQVTDPDQGSNPTVRFAGDLPEGFSADGSTLTVSAKAGDYTVRTLAQSGDAVQVERFAFHVQGVDAKVQSIIDESGIANSLVSLYVYDKPAYEDYAAAKALAAKYPSQANLDAFRKAVETAQSKVPKFTRVRFLYRSQQSNGEEIDKDNTIRLYADATEATDSQKNVNSGTLLATTGRVPEKDTVANSWTAPLSTSQWIDLAQAVSGRHELTVQTDHWSTRLTAFELSTEDGSVTKRIDAISYTGRGDFRMVIDRANDGTAQSDADKLGVFGYASWVRYTLDAGNYDVSAFVFPGSHVTGPYFGKPGDGIGMSLVPAVVTSLGRAKAAYDARDQYTLESAQSFEAAYEAALHAVDDFEAADLTDAKSNDLAKTLDDALAGLKTLDGTVSVSLPAGSDLTLDASGNNNGDLTGPNLSKNPVVTGEVGKDIAFSLDVPAGSTVTLDGFGFRPTFDTDAKGLNEIDPDVADKPVLAAGENGSVAVSWNYWRPGNYRARFQVKEGESTVVKSVEIVLRNAVDRTDLHPEYARLRFNAFQDPKTIDLFLTPVNDDGSLDTANAKQISFADLTRTGGKFVLTQWLKLPDGFDYARPYQLTMKAYDTYIYVDWIEFATSSYAKLYPSDTYDTGVFQQYPLSASGVMRIEAEHYDRSNIKDYGFVDFNGRHGFENGNPGLGNAAVRVGGLWNQNAGATVDYYGVRFAATAPAAAEVSLHVKGSDAKEAYAFKGATVPLEVTGDAAGISYATSAPVVATVAADGTVTAMSAGDADITALNAANSDAVTVHVADPAYLASLVGAYDTTIAGHERDYTSSSWFALIDAYAKATAAKDSKDAKTVYEAAAALKSAIDGRKGAASLLAWNAYKAIAEGLTAADYTADSFAEVTDALAAGVSFDKDTPQTEVNKAAGTLQRALYALVEATSTPADTAALVELANTAAAIEKAGQSGYSDAAWQLFADSLAKARDVLKQEQTTHVAVRVAKEALENALKQLDAERQTAFQDLAAAYAKVQDVDGAAYTPASFDAFAKARDAAKAMLDGAADSTATPDAIRDAARSLEDAAAALVAKADFSALKAKVDEYAGVQKGSATDDSWNAFQRALDAARGVLADANASQQQVDEALHLLENAKSALVEQPAGGDNGGGTVVTPGAGDNGGNAGNGGAAGATGGSGSADANGNGGAAGNGSQQGGSQRAAQGGLASTGSAVLGIAAVALMLLGCGIALVRRSAAACQ